MALLFLSFRWSVEIAEVYFRDLIGGAVLVLTALANYSRSGYFAERVCILVAA